MKKFINVRSTMLLGLLALAGFAYAESASSRYASGSTSAAVLFDSIRGQGWNVTSAESTSDLAGSLITYQAKLVTTPTYRVTASGSTSQAVIALNATTGIASNDVCYVKPASGLGYVVTVIGTTSSNITASANLGTAVAAGDTVAEINTILTVPVGAASINRNGVGLVKTVGDSPLRAVVTGTSACALGVTAQPEAR